MCIICGHGGTKKVQELLNVLWTPCCILRMHCKFKFVPSKRGFHAWAGRAEKYAGTVKMTFVLAAFPSL